MSSPDVLMVTSVEGVTPIKSRYCLNFFKQMLWFLNYSFNGLCRETYYDYFFAVSIYCQSLGNSQIEKKTFASPFFLELKKVTVVFLNRSGYMNSRIFVATFIYLRFAKTSTDFLGTFVDAQIKYV